MITDDESVTRTMIIPYNDNLYNVTVLGTVVMCGYSGVLSSGVSLFYGEKIIVLYPVYRYVNHHKVSTALGYIIIQL